MTIKKLTSVILLTGFALNSYCGMSSTNMKVTATVLPACSVSTLPLMFKNYNPLSPEPTEADTLLSVRCSNTLPYTIRMDAGVNGGDKPYDYNHQAMTGSDPSQKLYYNIYTDPTYTHIWGDGATNGSVAVSGVGNGQVVTIPAYGRILAEQKTGMGNFEDTVMITIIY